MVPEESWGAALCYFTGSKAHNVAFRRVAQKRGLKLNEYGLFSEQRRIAGRTEAEVYRALGLQFVPPELREDRGEVAAAQAGTLPEVIPYGALRGDLQVLAGAEVNIRRDGSLDIAADVLAKLDVVGVGVHAYFHLPRHEIPAAG